MTTLCTADLHVSSNPRDAYRWLFLEKTLPALIVEHRVTRVIICGDLTEAKAGHSAELVNRLVDSLAGLAELASIYLLKGNHDFQSEDCPFFRFTRHLPRVRWINEPTALKLLGLGDCLFLPHSRDPSKEWKPWLAGPRNWYFCHQTFKGASLSQGHKAMGMAAPFSIGARVVSGDVHVPQKIGPMTYVGAPYTVDFGDDYSPRVLLLEGREMRPVPVPGPQKRLAHVPTVNELKRLTGIYPGDIMKVRVELPPKTALSRAEVRAQVRAWAEEARVQLHAVEIIAPKVTSIETSRDRHRASDADLVRTYAKKMMVDKAVVAVGLKLIEEGA